MMCPVPDTYVGRVTAGSGRIFDLALQPAAKAAPMAGVWGAAADLTTPTL